jgi:inhibitor of cysteine peptidase
MRILPLLLAATLLARDGHAAEPAPLPPVLVTIADQGKTIELKPGQTMQVVLDANRTTGFSWTVEKVDAALLTLVGQPVYAIAEPKPGMVGVGGTETWHLLAVAPGEQRIQFFYRRPFEPDVPPARTFALIVRIKS